MPEIRAALPKYLQIAQDIRERITRGDLPAGAEVPSERQLASAWQVARPTAARALETLRRDGLVETRRGAGTFVRDVRVHRRAWHRYHRFRQVGAQYGEDETVRIVTAEIVDAPTYVVEALRLVESRAMMRRRVISRNTRPAEISTSWWPAELAPTAPRLLVRESLGGIGSVRYVEAVTGRRAAYARDQVSARLALGHEARELGLGDQPLAVLIYRHTVFDADDAPLEFAEAIYPPDTWSVEQEYPVEE
ncbi:MAG: GntR family transcriptional regulator [Pseudonocardia sp.]|nr:GntR family transcriptional regulator [Pseudonocardia sp.]